MGNQPLQSKIQQLVAAAKAGDAQAVQTLQALSSDPAAGPVIHAVLQAQGLVLAEGKLLPVSNTANPWGAALAQMDNAGATASPPVQGPGLPPTGAGAHAGSYGALNQTQPSYQAPLHEPGSGGFGVAPALKPGDRGYKPGDTRKITPITGGNTGDGGGYNGSDVLTPGDTPDPSGISSQHPEWANTFFGNLAPGSLDSLAGNTPAAWQIYQTQGLGGGGIQNQVAKDYAQNDFQAGMTLGDLFGGVGHSAGDTLGYADQFTNAAVGGGGSYADPRKILTQGLAIAAQEKDPNLQYQKIMDVVNSAGAYMSPGQFESIKSKIQMIVDQYITNQYKSGNPGGSNGDLLSQVYQAVGV